MRIEKSATIGVPVEKVWAALTNSADFGAWFHAALEGQFAAGEVIRAQSTYPGHEDAKFEIRVQRIEPPGVFAFEWKALAETLFRQVTFTLSAFESGTFVRIVESGFEYLSPDLREKALKDNAGGWEIQLRNLADYVTSAAARA